MFLLLSCRIIYLFIEQKIKFSSQEDSGRPKLDPGNLLHIFPQALRKDFRHYYSIFVPELLENAHISYHDILADMVFDKALEEQNLSSSYEEKVTSESSQKPEKESFTDTLQAVEPPYSVNDGPTFQKKPQIQANEGKFINLAIVSNASTSESRASSF